LTGIELHCGDAMAILPRLPDCYVITDPPYGVNLMSHGTLFRACRGERPAFRKRTKSIIDGDENQAIGAAVLAYCSSRGWPVAAFSSPLHPWPGEWRQQLIWNKGPAVGIGGDRKTCWKTTHEVIQIGMFPEVFGSRDESILHFPITPDNYADHVAAKPLNLCRYLIDKLVPPDGVVLDPFMGSGRIGVAAMQRSRRFIGIEIDPSHFALASRRLREVDGAGSLFDPCLFPPEEPSSEPHTLLEGFETVLEAPAVILDAAI